MIMFFELFYSEKYLSSQAGLESTTSPAIRSLWILYVLTVFIIQYTTVNKRSRTKKKIHSQIFIFYLGKDNRNIFNIKFLT